MLLAAGIIPCAAAGSAFVPHRAEAQSPVVIRSTEPPAWGASVRLVREVHIGVLDGDPDYELGRVRNVAIGQNGRIIVADDAASALRMYDANGKFVRLIGGRGEGPGEYRSLGGVRTLPDGRIALWDNRLRRLTTWTATGNYINSVTLTDAGGLFAADLFHIDHEGVAYVQAMVGRTGVRGEWRMGWVRASLAGRILDTLAIPVDPNPEPSFSLSSPSGYDRPFTRELVSTMTSRGALLVGDNRTYGFELRRAGAPTVRIERGWTPVALQRDERVEWEAWARMFERRAAASPPAAPGVTVIGAPPSTVRYAIPRAKPPFSELRSDAEERIWVRRYVTAVSRPGPERAPGDERPRRVWREPTTYDVFERSGRFLGTVTLPWNTRFEDAAGMHVWLTGTGEQGEDFVGRYRLVTR